MISSICHTTLCLRPPDSLFHRLDIQLPKDAFLLSQRLYKRPLYAPPPSSFTSSSLPQSRLNNLLSPFKLGSRARFLHCSSQNFTPQQLEPSAFQHVDYPYIQHLTALLVKAVKQKFSGIMTRRIVIDLTGSPEPEEITDIDGLFLEAPTTDETIRRSPSVAQSDVSDEEFDFDQFLHDVVVIDNGSDSDSDLEIIKTTQVQPTTTPARPAPRARQFTESFLDSYTSQGQTIALNDTLELQPQDHKRGDILKVIQIIRKKKGVFLRGQLFRRSVYLPEVSHMHINEVTLKRNIQDRDTEHEKEQRYDDVPVSRVLIDGDELRKREVIKSCDAWPAHNPKSVTTKGLFDKEFLKRNGPLFCRTIYSAVWEDVQKKKKLVGEEIRRVRLSESHPAYSDCLPSERHETFDRSEAIQHREGGITYGSGCAGAGGDVTGAKMAGAQVMWAFDKDQLAAESLRANHDGLLVLCMDQSEALEIVRRYKVDIMHTSWPCQAFSPANTAATTTQGQRNNEINSALILATKHHLQVMQPLYHTQENTFGLKSIEKAKYYFRTIISDMLDQGYNVQWRVSQFTHYGLVSSRKRLITIASLYQVPMPAFPLPTHGPEGSGLQPYTTMWDACGHVPPDATYHNQLGMCYYYPERKEPYDPERKRSIGCLTTKSNLLGHWNGFRALTPRECACCQEFPIDCIFKGSKTQIVKQIGNAVPPKVWSQFVKSIMKTLQDWRDGKIDDEGRPMPRPSSHHQQESILLPQRQSPPPRPSSRAPSISLPIRRPQTGSRTSNHERSPSRSRQSSFRDRASHHQQTINPPYARPSEWI
ncbi:S-adenosyl-L-methionine-dependent methyltransferase [Microthyrium microscopicum]|uniref:DNA (cytosine-5-)-methyltransferase n=1 Tax=Microthyrium microscopicum TaxID=703497 RepID=A0A6A6UJ46_9PEZI|nr:S-adenosyl-L-methionine-dependent methyltransferase [Microthyrium microscopicum]